MEIKNGAASVAEREQRELSNKITRQVNEILKQASSATRAPAKSVAYRVPQPGVRYYL